jgi:beta-phosphoglucomutase-like phosphatase (HAD superfamily)
LTIPLNVVFEIPSISADEAVAFEDSPAGISSSVAANIPTVGIASTSAPEDLEGLGVELVVRDFANPRLEAFIEGR